MKQIRRGVFETNSSSTHSICLAKSWHGTLDNTSDFITLKIKKFYWDYQEIRKFEDKVNFLWTAFIVAIFDNQSSYQYKAKAGLKCLLDILKKYKIYYDIDLSVLSEEIYIYITSDTIAEILSIFYEEPDKMERFLLLSDSFAIISNDNEEDNRCAINIDYPADLYGDYKRNYKY